MPPNVRIGDEGLGDTLIALNIDVGSEVIFALATRRLRTIKRSMEEIDKYQQ
jgi:hypothetical protein